jgi:hypothetical protein
MPSRHTRNGRSKSGQLFVYLPHWMLKSVAYRSLTAQARAIHVELIMIYNSRNNGSLALSARDAATRCNINKDTAGRAFKELIEKGFVECVTPGGFSRKDPHATEWRLTHLLCNKTGGVPTKPFMRWSAENQNSVRNEGQSGPKSRTGSGVQ